MTNDLKQRIIETSFALFLRHGIKSITMDYIASQVGISKRTLYELFKDKDQLVLSDGPPDAGIAVGVCVAPQDRVREVGEDVLDFHFGTFLKGSYFRRIVQ